MCWIQAEADRRHSHHCATKEEEEEAFHGVYLISGTPTMMDGFRLCIIFFRYGETSQANAVYFCIVRFPQRPRGRTPFGERVTIYLPSTWSPLPVLATAQSCYQVVS